MPRFVILRHELPGPDRGGVHWDFMLEQDGTLRTWALAKEPAIGGEILADALANHRLAYLDYEGPIAGNRGSVLRWDRGEYKLLVDTPEKLVVQLHGGRLVGTASLRPAGNNSQRWIFDFST